MYSDMYVKVGKALISTLLLVLAGVLVWSAVLIWNSKPSICERINALSPQDKAAVEEYVESLEKVGGEK